MQKFCFDYKKRKYREKSKLCYMDADNFTVYIKVGDIQKDIAEDVEIRLYISSNYQLNRELRKKD